MKRVSEVEELKDKIKELECVIEDLTPEPYFDFDESMVFEEDQVIALFLQTGIIFSNSYWSMKHWPEEARTKTALFVICNDIFAWACADAEEIDYDEFETLYAYYKKDDNFGSSVWCIKKRGIMPQKPVYEAIMREGIWDLDKMKLKPNPYDNIL